jgi:hypothetical protein
MSEVIVKSTTVGDPKAWLRVQAYARENATGFALSAVLHGLALVLLLYFIRNPAEVRDTVGRVFPVDLVRLASETEGPRVPEKGPVQASAPRGEATSPAPARVSPEAKKQVPLDAFDAKLRALAQLRQPDAVRPLDNQGAESRTAGEDGGISGYSLRDYVRAQVLRHWSLDYSVLGERRFSVPIRVEMTARGVIAKAEIVDRARYAVDPVYHEIALSARNAVILSSPIPLPPGHYSPVMNFTLNLDPADTNR